MSNKLKIYPNESFSLRTRPSSISKSHESTVWIDSTLKFKNAKVITLNPRIYILKFQINLSDIKLLCLLKNLKLEK